ncbi:splicing factor, arginine/serine-rich 4 [Rhodotorula toruloides]|uniref:Splicing factor, arginine/serine-rich 4 n=1 Tax=Rhodotorula toruloides TaxID=5286 RepID=A0A511KLF3_RHOTO|nr:splicing factor, arginine/serine-rich 4 [Rhodotorula toruloides]
MQAGRRLYVGRVPQAATRADFDDVFGRMGKLVDVRIMAGFAFIEYADLRDAEEAVNELNNKDFLGDRIMVEFAKPPRSIMDDRFGGPPPRGGGYGGGYGGPPSRGFDRPPPPRAGSGFRITIQGLREGTSWQDVKDFARQAGTVSFADVDRRDPTVGFVEYNSRYDAEDAVRKLHDTELNGAKVSVVEDFDSRGGGGRDRDSGRDRDRDHGRSDRDRDDGYRKSTRDLYDERDRRETSRRSPSPRRSRSPARRRSPTPDRRERDRSPRDRSRSPRRD